MTAPEQALSLIQGVRVSPYAQEKFVDFEKQYLLVREKEKRVLSSEEIKALPYPSKGSVDYALWKIRRKNIRRFMSYISGHSSLRILDVGCGNGFFTNMLTRGGNQVCGVDINLTELTQAAAAFPDPSIHWYYLDLLEENIPEEPFDLVTFCTSFHYFNEPEKLLDKCLRLLKPNGEIHIIDSPFYTEQGRTTAKKNSETYFRSLNAEGMSAYYHHNTLKVLENYSCEFKYKPRRYLTRFLGDSPFPWVLIRNRK